MDEQLKERIESYIIGTLPPQEIESLEALMATDEVVREEYLFQKELHAVIPKLETDQEIRKTIQSEGERYLASRQEKRPRLASRRFLMLAAAAVILIAAILLPGLFRQPSGQELFAENFSPAEFIEIDRGTDEGELSAARKTAYDAYAIKNYDSALTAFEALLTNQKDPKDLHYAASAALSLDEPDLVSARDFYREILAQGDNIYRASAHWNLALIACGVDDFAEAKNALTNLLAMQKNKYSERGEKLLRKLEKR